MRSNDLLTMTFVVMITAMAVGCQAPGSRILTAKPVIPAAVVRDASEATVRAQDTGRSLSGLSQSMEMPVDALRTPIHLDEPRSAQNEEDESRFTLAVFAGTMYGIRSEYKLADDASLGFNYGFATTGSKVGQASDIDFLWYPTENKGEFRPYLIAGAGFYAKANLDKITSTGGLATPIGGGVKWAFNEWGALRLDLRDYLVFGTNGGMTNIEATGGLDFRF